MGVIIVPFNYNEESNFSVVPICIGDIDPDGNPIHRAWVGFRSSSRCFCHPVSASRAHSAGVCRTDRIRAADREDLSAEPYLPQPTAPVARNTLSVITRI